MKPLIVDISSHGMGVDRWGIAGYTPEELAELKAMPHEDRRQRVLQDLDERNMGLGTCWMCGNGVYGVSVLGDMVYAEVGTTCD